MTPRGFHPVLALVLLGATSALAQQEGTAAARRARPAPASKPTASAAQEEDRALLRQLAEAQRGLGEQMQQLKDQVEGLRGELAKEADLGTAREEEQKALRDEVKGLYVESSAVKQQIEALRQDVTGVNSNVSAFRTFSGFFIAVMILLLAVIFVLTIRR